MLLLVWFIISCIIALIAYCHVVFGEIKATALRKEREVTYGEAEYVVYDNLFVFVVWLFCWPLILFSTAVALIFKKITAPKAKPDQEVQP